MGNNATKPEQKVNEQTGQLKTGVKNQAIQQNLNKQNQKPKKKKQIPDQRQGLPNIGNTCFLNSIIQLLVSSKNLRESIIQQFQKEQQNKLQKSPTPQKNSIIQYIKEIFSKIVYGSTLQQKRKTMKNIVKYLSKNSIDYQSYSQQDSFYFLMFLLNKLFKEKSDLEQLFKINFKFICKNQKCKKNDQFQQYTMDSTQFVCKKCNEANIIVFLNQPKIILYMGAAKNQIGIIRQSIYFKKKNQKIPNSSNDQTITYLEYRLKAKILYSGNGRSGHYIAARKKINEDNQNKISNNAKLYQFNDSSLHKIEQKSFEQLLENHSSNFTQKVCLYEFLQSISQKEYQKRKKEQDDLIVCFKEQKNRLEQQKRKKQEEQRKQRQEKQRKLRQQKQRLEELKRKKQEEQKRKKDEQQRQKEQKRKKEENQKLQRQKEQNLKKEKQRLAKQEEQNRKKVEQQKLAKQKEQNQKEEEKLKIQEEKKDKEKQEKPKDEAKQKNQINKEVTSNNLDQEQGNQQAIKKSLIQLNNPQTNQSKKVNNEKLKQSQSQSKKAIWSPFNCCMISRQLPKNPEFKVKPTPFYAYTINFRHYCWKFKEQKVQIRKVHFIYKKLEGETIKIKYLTPKQEKKYITSPLYQRQTCMSLDQQKKQQLIQQIKTYEKESLCQINKGNIDFTQQCKESSIKECVRFKKLI